MGIDRAAHRNLLTGACPVGWQKYVNPRLTRRDLLGGLVATSATLYSGLAEADAIAWYDLEFELSSDQSILSVSEIKVVQAADGGPETRTLEKSVWEIPAAAFGPAAFFDMEEPDDDGITQASAPVRSIYVRNVTYGLRFSKNNKTGKDGRKPGFVAFIFKRVEDRWQIAYLTDLWLLGNGRIEPILSKSVSFRDFIDKTRSASPTANIATDRVGHTLKAIFADMLWVTTPCEGEFEVALDQHLVWTVGKPTGSSIAAQEKRIHASELSFAWRQSSPETPEKVPADDGQAKPRDVMYFSAEATPGKVTLANAAGIIELGPVNGHHVKLRPRDPTGMRLDVMVGQATLRPADIQVVSALSAGDGTLAVADGAAHLSDGVAGTSLIFTQTMIPKSKFSLPRVLRSVLWGDAAGAGPLLTMPMAKDAKFGRGEITSTVGLLRIDRPAITIKSDEKSIKPEGEAKKAESQQLARFFQAANGDRGGSPESTFYVLHDRPAESKEAGSLRRIHIDVALFAANTALPDTSFSRLGFKHADLRLVYEDGTQITELLGGEYPRPISSSFIWLASPPNDPALPGSAWRRAAFDLSRATLTCARDYDLMKLRMRFHDLLLIHEPHPQIIPARVDARINVGEDGAVQDSRPILVAEFDPQHVMEEAVFRPTTPPLPDVDLKEAVEIELTGLPKFKLKTRAEIIAKLEELKGDDKLAQRKTVRESVKAAKIAQDRKDKPDPIDGSAPPPRPFVKMAEDFPNEVMARMKEWRIPEIQWIPEDQWIYIGPFALDPDGMAIARDIMKRVGPAAVNVELDAMFGRVSAMTTSESLKKDRLLSILVPNSTDKQAIRNAFDNALRNEATFEAMEPLYGVFRNFWRDQVVHYRSSLSSTGEATKETKSLDFTVPEYKEVGQEPERAYIGEYLAINNRPEGYPYNQELFDKLRTRFISFALGMQDIPDIMGARLSGRSRLAFRVDCEPAAGIDAYEAGIEKSSGDGPARPAPGNSRFPPIPFTFEALTDWSRYEPAVTKRARKLFQTLPSGILPRPGSRASNPSDQAMMRFQGFTESPITADSRMAEVRASLKSERIALSETGQDKPYPGEPLDFETAIEIPARLILSTAQDAIWRTNRRIPFNIPEADPDKHAPPTLDEGLEIAGLKEKVSDRPRDLWSVRLDTTDSPSLRAVASPDLRPSALSGYRTGDEFRLPGHGSPPRGPYAPWFIGLEQMDSGTLTAEEVSAKIDNGKEACPVPSAPKSKFEIIRWLCERAGFREALPTENYRMFRTSLDAFDRHQLVLQSSTYGLPVIGKRLPGPDPTDVDTAGVLIADSGQIEPGKAFTLLDASDDQALHKPVPLNVKALSLTALGGSFLHETSFKPSAGADDIFGRKIFEGFSIDTLQQDIVLGRDIRTEVVYKGYLLPLGHKASFVKLTERIFLRTPTQGIKAMLRQRMFLRMAEPTKLYGALGQPHSGRMWCGKKVRLIADKTPDILDPTFPLGKIAIGDREDRSGRVDLDTAPGLAFWPRTDITDRGLYRFEVTIDGTPTALPMMFLDNIAATTSESLKIAVDHYNRTETMPLNRRTLQTGGRKIDFAPNSKAGEAQFEANFIKIRAHGRTRTPTTASWTGVLEDRDNFVTTGVLEGAGQPPFYPAMELAEIRLGAVERMSGGTLNAVQVQYDGHYVLHGFKGDPPPRGIAEATGEQGNPKEVFLNLRNVVTLGMGNNGDRSGGIARPESHIVAISRSMGPLGGDEATWWSSKPDKLTREDAVTPNNGLPVPTGLDSVNLVSLAPYFNEKVPRPDIPAPQNSAVKPQVTDGGAQKLSELVKQVQAYFSFDAKLLGTIKLKDLMRLLGFNFESIPILKEIQEFGTAALRGANEQLDGFSNDVRSRVLVPLREVVVLLRSEWNKLDDEIKGKGIVLPASLGEKQPEPLGLAKLYPEVDSGLRNLQGELEKALATENAIALIPKLAAVHSAARGLIRSLAVLASNPIERLENAIIGDLRERLSGLTGAVENLGVLAGQLVKLKEAFIDGTADTVAKTISDFIFQNLAAGGAAEIEGKEKLLELLPLGGLPPDLNTILKSLIVNVDTEFTEFWTAVTSIRQQFMSRVETITREALKPMIMGALTNLFALKDPKQALLAGIESYALAVKSEVRNARDEAKESLKKFADSAEEDVSNAAKSLQLVLDNYADQLLGGAVDTAVAVIETDEVQALIAGLERLSTAIGNGKNVADAIKGGDPKAILKTSGEFAQDVLGIDVASVKSELDDSIKKPIIRAVKDAAQTVFSGPPLSLINSIAGQKSILIREIKALTELPNQPDLPGLLPLFAEDNPAKVVGSNELLVSIGEMLKLLSDRVAIDTAHPDETNDLERILTKIIENEGPINAAAEAAGQVEFGSTQLISFIQKTQILIRGEGDDHKECVIDDLRGLYGDIVNSVVAASGLTAFFSNIDPDSPPKEKEIFEAAVALMQELRRLSASIGDRLEKLVSRVFSFIADNEKIIATAGLLGGAIGMLQSYFDVGQELRDLKNKLAASEKTLVDGLVKIANCAFKLIGTSVIGVAEVVVGIEDGVARLAASAARLGLPLSPESDDLGAALKDVENHLLTCVNVKIREDDQKNLKTLIDLREAPVGNGKTIVAYFSKGQDFTPYREASQKLRTFEAAVLRHWLRLRNRIQGAPEELKKAAEKALIGTGIFGSLSAIYTSIAENRREVLAKAGEAPALTLFARRALLVEPHAGLAKAEDEDLSSCDVLDISKDTLFLTSCDRLGQEVAVLSDIEGLGGNDIDEILRRRIVTFFRNWGDGQASPLLIIGQAEELAKDILRGDVFAAIDLAAFRDQFEDAIAGLIPTKVNLAYDFDSVIKEQSDPQAIFQPKVGSDFGIILRASLDLLTQKSDFSATAHIGAFDIYLIGGIVDALWLKFGGAGFSVRDNASPRFDVIYEDFKIGKDLEFAQKLQIYLAPKDGNGVFIQPMTRSAGIEAGYGINLGTIGIGATSFFNVSLNVSAELPFGNEESLFKVSLGRRLSPFTMGVFPFVGSGYFAIYAAADGVRGFEASFEYGGGAAVGFGPLTAQCRIQLGVFIRILKVNGVKRTEIYGTFFAGGSASIWVFHFATSLYVRLGSAGGGDMYGEAIYSFSFSIGIADFDYSITAYKKEKKMGQQTALNIQQDRPVRYAALVSDTFTLTDAPDLLPAGYEKPAGKTGSEKGSGMPSTNCIIIKAADQSTRWDEYAGYFDVDLVKGFVS